MQNRVFERRSPERGAVGVLLLDRLTRHCVPRIHSCNYSVVGSRTTTPWTYAFAGLFIVILYVDLIPDY